MLRGSIILLLVSVVFATTEFPETEQETCDLVDLRDKLMLRLMDQTRAIEERIARLDTDNLHTKTEKIAFYAFLDNSLFSESRITLIFNRVMINDGEGYNKETGIFTCPVSGVYEFNFHVGQRTVSRPHSRQIWTYLYANDVMVAGAATETYRVAEDDGAGNTAILRLEKGSEVKLMMQFDVYGSEYMQTTFSGKWLYS